MLIVTSLPNPDQWLPVSKRVSPPRSRSSATTARKGERATVKERDKSEIGARLWGSQPNVSNNRSRRNLQPFACRWAWSRTHDREQGRRVSIHRLAAGSPRTSQDANL